MTWYHLLANSGIHEHVTNKHYNIRVRVSDNAKLEEIYLGDHLGMTAYGLLLAGNVSDCSCWAFLRLLRTRGSMLTAWAAQFNIPKELQEAIYCRGQFRYSSWHTRAVPLDSYVSNIFSKKLATITVHGGKARLAPAHTKRTYEFKLGLYALCLRVAVFNGGYSDRRWNWVFPYALVNNRLYAYMAVVRGTRLCVRRVQLPSPLKEIRGMMRDDTDS